MEVLMVGCGRMGGALAHRWQQLDGVRLSVVDPGAPQLPGGCPVFKDLDALPADRAFDVIVLAVKPQIIADVAPGCRPWLRPDGTFLSVAAGTSLASLAAACGETAIVRMMPNTPVAVGRGVVGLIGNPRMAAHQEQAVSRLADVLGETFWLPSEDALDRFTAIAGSGPGYVFEIADTYTAAARRLGFEPEDARRMVLGVIAGAVELASREERSLSDLRDAVVSKGGTTEAGLAALTRGGLLQQLLCATTEAAYERATHLR